MKILAIHADFIDFEAKKKAIKTAVDVPEGKKRVEECLVIYSAVEKRDENKLAQVVDRYVTEIKDIASQVKVKNIVLYPYAHLSSSLAAPQKAEEALCDAERKLASEFNVTRAPFGWYKSFTIACKGHPLSELSREFSGEEQKKETEEKKTEEKFTLSSAPTQSDKIKYSTIPFIIKAVKKFFPQAEVGTFGSHLGITYVDIANVKIQNEKLFDLQNEINKNIIKISPKEVSVATVQDKYQKKIAQELGDKAKAYQFGDGKESITLIPIYKDPFVAISKDIQVQFSSGTSSAYWKNVSNNTQLTRIHFTAGTATELEKYRKQQEELEKRDHKKLGPAHEIFMFHQTAPGMPYWLPKGVILYNELVNFWRKEHEKRGYQEIVSPLLNKKELYMTSGHYEHYWPDMFTIKTSEGEEYGVKAMNCPNAMVIFGSTSRSYRELPLRLSDTDTLHRNELSGTLNGLLRVREFRQDDAHIFVTEDMIEQEYKNVFEIVERFYSIFKMEYSFRLGTRPTSFMGDVKTWERAEAALKHILEKSKRKYTIAEGDGAFYGPKIDILMKDAIGRDWQMGTVQLDFQQPRRFNLEYIDVDGSKKTPIAIHRVVYGSLERFIGILIEHFAGKFPLWLSPLQVKIVTVADRNVPFAQDVVERLKQENIRVALNAESETIGKKVRDAQLEHVNYIVTIGDKELEQNSLAVRSRLGDVKFGVKVEEFVQQLKQEIEKKEIK